MRPLVQDAAGQSYKRYVLDLETAGLGAPGKRPRQLFVDLHDGETHEDFWGYGFGGTPRGPVVDAVDALCDRALPFEVMAHFGGGFDFKFCAEWLFGQKRAKAEVVNAGSNVLCVQGKIDGVPFRLVDTIRLLLTGLRTIGKALGKPKGRVEHDHDAKRCRGPVARRCGGCLARTAKGRILLRDYCRQDCAILWDAVHYAERLVAGIRGLRLRTTLASTATACIRAGLTEKTVADCDLQVDLDAEKAAAGGRVEPHSHGFGDARSVREKEVLALLYDVQSMYPWCMAAGPLPWRHLAETKRYKEGVQGFAEAEVEVPADCLLPVLPYRVTEGKETGRLYFPTGKWKGSFVCEELDYAVRVGAARILRCEKQHRFSGSDVMGDFARAVWAKRQSSRGFERQFWKIFNNSAFGKLLERRDKRRYVANPESAEGLTCVSQKYGLHFREVTYQPSFRHVPAGAAITARARVRLHEVMCDALKQGGVVHYCDTDSVLCSGATLPTGKDLGDLDLQEYVCRGIFAAAKFYALWCRGDFVDGEWVPSATGNRLRVIKKAKGLPRMTLKDTLRAMRGLPVRVDRTMGFRESLARAGTPGYERTSFVKVHKFGRPKRADGGARPWSVGELQA